MSYTDLTLRQRVSVGTGIADYWWHPSSTVDTQYIGVDPTTFVSDFPLNGSTSGITVISNKLQTRCRQDGYVRQVKLDVVALGLGAIKIKIFRPNGSNYDFIGESSETMIAPNLQTITLSTPIACRPGDIIGIYLAGDAQDINRVKVGATANAGTGQIKYTVGDISATNTFSSNLDGYVMNIEGLGSSPALAITGDSIAGGHPYWSTFYDSGPDGTLTSEPWYVLQQYYYPKMEYQNHAQNAEDFNFVANTGIISALATGPNRILIHCGVNDIQGGITWAAVLGELAIIRAAVSASIDLYIDEILPWTSGTDEQAATIRTWNANLASWCTSNSATLVICHDVMGKERASTGYLDDLQTAYDYDGIHLTAAGYAKLADLVRQTF